MEKKLVLKKFIGKLVLTVASVAFFCGSVRALTFTAIASGNFNNVLTWGGTAPGSLLSLDSVVIPSGITVTLNLDQTFTSSATLVVNGVLSSGSNTTSLIMSGATLSGSGMISTDSLVLGMGSGFNFNGTINTQALTSLGTIQTSNASITVANNLYLNNGAYSVASGSVTLSNNANIIMNGGSISVSGSGSLTLSNPYNVTYNSAGTAGIELTGPGLKDVTLNLSSGAVSLSSNLGVNGTMTLNSGNLSLNGYNLSFNTNGNFSASGSGTINASTGSNISINSSGSFSGGLRFGAGNNTLNNFTLNMSNSSSNVSLGSDLTINGSLNLNSGTLVVPATRTLTLAQNTSFNSVSSLTVNGTLNGATNAALLMTSGTLAGSGTINVDTAALALMSGFNFTGTLNVHQLSTSGSNQSTAATVNVNNNLYLSSGTYSVSSGSVNLYSGATINMNGGSIAVSGSGALGISNPYNVVYTSASTTSGIELTGSGLNNLTLNMSSGSLTLTNDLAMNGTLTLNSGNLVLNNYNMSFGTNGNFSATGSGTINSTLGSNISISSSNTFSGGLRFGNGANTVNNFTLNMGSGSNSVSLGSALNVNGTLSLTNGDLVLNNNDLTFSGNGNFAAVGSGTISTSSASNISVMSNGSLSGALRFSPSAHSINNFSVSMGGGSSSVAIGSNLDVNGTLTLSLGTLVIPTGTTLTMANNLVFNTTSSLTVNGTLTSGSNNSALLMTAGTLGGNGTINVDSAVLGLMTGFNFTGAMNVNQLTSVGSMQSTAATVAVNNNLYVNSGTFDITSGSVNLASNANIMMNGGSLHVGGSGAMGLSNTYNVTYTSGSATSGVELSGAGLNNLNLNMSSGSLTLSSGTTVNGTLNLNSGKINLGTNNLNIGASGNVSGGSSSSYIITSGGGSLILHLGAGSSATFPVGTSLNFAPAVITAGTGSASSDIGITVNDSVYQHGTVGTNLTATQSLVNATWLVSSTATSGLNLNMQLMWSAGMELNGFNRSNAYISHYTGGSWDAVATSSATASAGMYAMTRNNITSLSPFTVADNNAHLNLGVTPIATNISDVTIYPNPAVNNLYFTTSGKFDKIDIYDMGGRMLKSVNVGSNNISISELPAGTYNISFDEQEQHTVRKFVKE